MPHNTHCFLQVLYALVLLSLPGWYGCFVWLIRLCYSLGRESCHTIEDRWLRPASSQHGRFRSAW